MKPLQRAGPGTGREPLAHTAIGASLADLRGNGPIAKRGGKLVAVSNKCPLVGTRPASAATIGASYAAVSWSWYGGLSDDAVWTSASEATIATAGYYDLDALIGMGVSATNKTAGAKWQKNGEDLAGSPAHESTSTWRVQVRAWEPWVRLNIGDVVRVMAFSESASDTWRESRCSIRLVQEIPDMPPQIGTGATMAYDGRSDEVWLTLDAASSNITGVTPVTVIGVTGLPAGSRWSWDADVYYQTTATTTGVLPYAGISSAPTKWYARKKQATTGTTTAVNAPTGAGATAAGNLFEAQDTRTNDGAIGATSVSVDAADTDVLLELTGGFTTNAAGDFRAQLAAELAGLVCRASIGTTVRLRRLS